MPFPAPASDKTPQCLCHKLTPVISPARQQHVLPGLLLGSSSQSDRIDRLTSCPCPLNASTSCLPSSPLPPTTSARIASRT
eukprot:762508-Hanusia_phi.AAC.1